MKSEEEELKTLKKKSSGARKGKIIKKTDRLLNELKNG
jgi:hypothetical protein